MRTIQDLFNSITEDLIDQINAEGGARFSPDDYTLADDLVEVVMDARLSPRKAFRVLAKVEWIDCAVEARGDGSLTGYIVPAKKFRGRVRFTMAQDGFPTQDRKGILTCTREEWANSKPGRR